MMELNAFLALLRERFLPIADVQTESLAILEPNSDAVVAVVADSPAILGRVDPSHKNHRPVLVRLPENLRHRILLVVFPWAGEAHLTVWGMLDETCLDDDIGSRRSLLNSTFATAPPAALETS